MFSVLEPFKLVYFFRDLINVRDAFFRELAKEKADGH